MKQGHLMFCYPLASLLRRFIDNMVYTVRSGVATGLKRRGGFGFIPTEASPEEEFLLALDLRGKTVFDVGGYEGIYTMFFARAVGPQGQVITFEPNPVNYARIRENVRLNGFTNVTLKPIALADRKTTAEFLFPVREPARGTLHADYQVSLAGQFESRTLTVDLDTLDNQLQDFPAPDFVKIDVEGAELEVLAGMQRTINQCRPALFIEVHSGVDVGRLVRLLADSDYKISHVETAAAITPENAAFENGHLYCCSRAEAAVPNKPAPALQAA